MIGADEFDGLKERMSQFLETLQVIQNGLDKLQANEKEVILAFLFDLLHTHTVTTFFYLTDQMVSIKTEEWIKSIHDFKDQALVLDQFRALIDSPPTENDWVALLEIVEKINESNQKDTESMLEMVLESVKVFKPQLFERFKQILESH